MDWWKDQVKNLNVSLTNWIRYIKKKQERKVMAGQDPDEDPVWTYPSTFLFLEMFKYEFQVIWRHFSSCILQTSIKKGFTELCHVVLMRGILVSQDQTWIFHPYIKAVVAVRPVCRSFKLEIRASQMHKYLNINVLLFDWLCPLLHGTDAVLSVHYAGS